MYNDEYATAINVPKLGSRLGMVSHDGKGVRGGVFVPWKSISS